ncbi:MAG: hypothetical protein HQ541_08715 [Mariniphaga sp.]|nr:hypothetical protein [Mariniphaga sp.]
MEEAERLCDTIAIIDVGKIIAKGTLNELKQISKVKDLLTIKTSELNETKNSKLKESIPTLLNGSNNVIEVECTNIGNDISAVINAIQNAGITIERIDTQVANLESIFLKLTGKQLRD